MVNGKKLQRQYRNKLCDFNEWKYRYNGCEGVIFPQNVGPNLSIDETSLSHGELYTIVTNKTAKGKKGTVIAILKGTNSDSIIPLLGMNYQICLMKTAAR